MDNIRVTVGKQKVGTVVVANNGESLSVSKVSAQRVFDGASLKVSLQDGMLKNAGQDVTLDNVLAFTRNRLDSLVDVEEGALAVEGATLVYDATLDKYIVRPMQLDGGEF